MKISVITVCFNSEKTIKDTIESVLSQDYKNIEYIIVDADSSDETKNIIQQFDSNVVSEKYIKLYKNILIENKQAQQINNFKTLFFNIFIFAFPFNSTLNYFIYNIIFRSPLD